MTDLLVRIFGWRATMLHGDPCVFDRWMFVRRYLRSGPERTLDAGAGNGGFVLMAGSHGNEAIGLSFGTDELARARRRAALVGMNRVMFRDCDLRRLDDFSDDLGTFDQILCLEVIEHVEQDQQLLDRLAGLLRPGGQLLLSTPSANHRYMIGDAVSVTEDGGHVRWGYAPDQLAPMLRSAGLTVVAQRGISGFASQLLTSLMRRGQRIHPAVGWAIVLPLRVLQVLDRPLTRILRWPYLSVTAVATRPGSPGGRIGRPYL